MGTGSYLAAIIALIVIVAAAFLVGANAMFPAADQAGTGPLYDQPGNQPGANEPGTGQAGPDTGQAGQEYRVEIQNYAFTPQILTVKVGTTVTWVNRDAVQHTVDWGDVESSALNTGDSFQYTFLTPGTYSYYCSLHPQMTGKIIVTE